MFRRFFTSSDWPRATSATTCSTALRASSGGALASASISARCCSGERPLPHQSRALRATSGSTSHTTSPANPPPTAFIAALPTALRKARYSAIQASPPRPVRPRPILAARQGFGKPGSAGGQLIHHMADPVPISIPSTRRCAMILGKMWRAFKAQMNKLANHLWKADPVAQMQYEYDKAVDQLKEGRQGVEQYRAMVERVGRQVEKNRTNIATLEAKTKSYLGAGDRETAAR